ncbi:lactoperoxidase-like isoform X3 [Xenia sp. Carnegie-2017]|uniref:lactoperoxidase-like isoform X3 n=1 Tax=Xenia sp. Carnegie-2017 TaxID=2897299 RepID=UPI001F042FC4|nr:lactoperoxidase-like isoform X3 [Xenia sp. Carnegie-2017]
MKILFIFLMMLYTPKTQAKDSLENCIFSESVNKGIVLFKAKFKADDSSKFKMKVNDKRFLDFFALDDGLEGKIKLAKSLQGFIPFNGNDTFKINIELKNNIHKSNINLIMIKEGIADGLMQGLMYKMSEVKPSNPFRPVSGNYSFVKRLHSILMYTKCRKTKASSLAACKFSHVFKQARKEIKTKINTNADIFVGPQALFSAKSLQKLIKETECSREVTKIKCRKSTRFYRTINGTCNNLLKPTRGAAESVFLRLLPALYFDAEGLSEPAGGGLDQPNAPDLPNPSKVTDEYIVIQNKNQPNRDGITHLFMQWGQFLDHDLTLAPESENGDICADVPCDGSAADFVDPCFPILPVNNRSCIRMIRSAARCQIDGYKLEPREQINVNTAYIDGSMIYGSMDDLAKQLRDRKNDRGLLATSGDNLLPIDNSLLGEPDNLCENLGSCFLAGDSRVNEQAALAAMHTLWVREHNRIATGLREINPFWKGEKIYQETRKIIGALVQQITYKEWLPILIGKNALRRYKRYRPKVNSGISNEFATIAFRLGHSLVRPKFDFLKRDYKPFPFSPVPLRQVFFNNTLVQRYGIDGWIIGLVGNVSQEMDNEMAIGLTNELFQRDVISREGLNLAALNMQRAREHGLSFYSDILASCQRKYPGLYPANLDLSNVKSFDELTDLFKPEVLKSLKEVYNDKPQNTDVFPAGIGENPRDKNFVPHISRKKQRYGTIDDCLPDPILGPTFTCLVIDQFERLRDGDRFYFEKKRVFKFSQRRAMKQRKLSDIICSNVDIISIQRNAFLDNHKYSCDSSRKLDLTPWTAIPRKCRPNPCQNGGSCRLKRRKVVIRGKRRRRFVPTCRCTFGFEGRWCQKKKQ